MQVFRDTLAIRSAPDKVPALPSRFTWRLAEVPAETAMELGETLTIVLADRGGTVQGMTEVLGFDLSEEGAKTSPSSPVDSI
jgi:hypothetical protein